MSLIGVPDAHNDRVNVADSGSDVRPVRLAVVQPEQFCSGSGCGNWTDQQLVFAASGDRDAAFAELFRRRSGDVAAAARMVLGKANSATDDVVAEVFAALWCSPARFDPNRGSLLTYLRLAARGRSLDLLRSESSRQRRERHDESSSRLRSAIDDELLAAESDEALRHSVAQLPDDERIAIELAYFAQMTYRAVADRLGLPEGTVKSRIRRGLQHLRGGAEIGNRPRGEGSSSATTGEKPRAEGGAPDDA